MTTLIDISIRAGCLIVLMLLVRRCSAVPKRLLVILWDLVLVRLLTPVMIEIPWVTSLSERGPSGGTETVAAQPGFPWKWVWLVGCMVMGLIMLRLYLREYQMLREALPLPKDQASRLRAILGKNGADICISDRIHTPVAFGLLHPKIILPKSYTGWSTQTAVYALHHEFVHVQRLDNLRKLLMAAALVIHWFNPLVWVMRSMFDRDIERACDEKVIADSGEDARSSYANALLDLAARKQYWSVCGNGFGRNAIHERIVSMMKHKKTTLFAVILAVGVLAVAATAFAQASPVPQADDAVPEKAGLFETISYTAAEVDGDSTDIIIETESTESFSVDMETGEVTQNGEVIGRIDMDEDGFPMNFDLGGDPANDVSIIVTGEEEDGSYRVTAVGQNVEVQ